MTATARTFLTRLAMLLVAACFAVTTVGCATAQSQEQARGWSRAELEQLLAPVALYPDALLAQLLIASTYPDEIVEAARWSRMHPELAGDDAVRFAEPFDWDPSVKSLLAVPGLLARMDEKIDWTRALGDAFLAQEEDVMDAVQELRRRARIEGSLVSDERIEVSESGSRVSIVLASPSVIYLPHYDPRVVYGRWWWPTHPPVIWEPWPGYRYVPRVPGLTVSLWWSPGVRVSADFFYGGIDWPRRQVQVVRVDTWYVHRAIERRAPQRVVVIKPGRWHHEPTRRHVGARPWVRHVADRPGPAHAASRAEVRQPERQPGDVRQPDERISQHERPRPEWREVREHPRPTAQPAPQREARRPEVQQAERARPEARERPRPEPREAREHPRPIAQPAPQREARRPEVQRAERARPEARGVSRDAPERARAPAQREPQRVQRPEPQREARQSDRGADTDADARRREPRAQSAERGGPRPAAERRPRNSDEPNERRPQS